MIRSTAAAACLVSALCGAAHGQEIPPACKQLVNTMEACTGDLANWGDFNDPAGAAKLRASTQASVSQLRAGLKQAVKEKGTIAVAQYCASHNVKEKIIGDMGGMITPVLMNGGNADNCKNALARMQ